MKITLLSLTCAALLAGCVTVTNSKGERYELTRDGLNPIGPTNTNRYAQAKFCTGQVGLEQVQTNPQFTDGAYVGYYNEHNNAGISLDEFINAKTARMNEFDRARSERAYLEYYNDRQYIREYHLTGFAELGEYDFDKETFPLHFYNRYEIDLGAMGEHTFWLQLEKFAELNVPTKHAEAFLKQFTKKRPGQYEIDPSLSVALGGRSNQQANSNRRVRYYTSFSQAEMQDSELHFQPTKVIIENIVGDCSYALPQAKTK